ncbi:hypothetical protein HDU98_010523 [Podochytrium sp. JEL0797]|nr:hypothetical protein HDU98_010523 [Podochytrium sp. JEL0797]
MDPANVYVGFSRVECADCIRKIPLDSHSRNKLLKLKHDPDLLAWEHATFPIEPHTPSSSTSPTNPTPSDIANRDAFVASLVEKIRRDPVFTEHRLDDEYYGDVDGDAESQKELDTDLVHHAACAGSPYFWSFCRNKLEEAKQVWHCVVCCECRDVGWIHCEKCDVCVQGKFCKKCKELEEESAPAPFHHHNHHHGLAKRKSLK